jgi:hypothetical protein
VPITTPSSTSQSDFCESSGNITLSFGPFSDVLAFRNTIGSVGSGMPASAAWSA